MRWLSSIFTVAQVSVFFFALAAESVFTRPPPRSMVSISGVRDARMLFDAVDVGEPDYGEHEAQRTHEPEAAAPAGHVNEPSKDGREDGQREILRGVEDCRGASALRGGKPGGDDAAVAGKDGRLSQAGKHAENEDGGECGAGGEVSGEGGEKCEDRPQMMAMP